MITSTREYNEVVKQVKSVSELIKKQELILKSFNFTTFEVSQTVRPFYDIRRSLEKELNEFNKAKNIKWFSINTATMYYGVV